MTGGPSSDLVCEDPGNRDEWHVIAAMSDLADGARLTTPLLGASLSIERQGDDITVTRTGTGRPVPAQVSYGYVWASLGAPNHALFAIPECAEPDRRNLHAATLGVQVSAPRAIENFLDLGHFPFVHTDFLGIEPHTEVKPYEVALTENDGEIFATRCLFYQPRGAANAGGGYEVEYVYRVPHPYCSVLYKANPVQRARMDVIALFVQPVGEERIRAHMFLSMLDDTSSDTAMRAFQLLIFGQDKPILENQRPRKLPLDPRAEMPVRADAMSLAYRRWLSQRGVRYGTIPAGSAAERAA